ncbi:MAG: hypothetical protein D3910_13865, partial [Candidatus Electrothrix sp. ATG2]|nr:hypothetical protein [Candidatus Electrothrix sp. ATG2]
FVRNEYPPVTCLMPHAVSWIASLSGVCYIFDRTAKKHEFSKGDHQCFRAEKRDPYLKFD